MDETDQNSNGQDAPGTVIAPGGSPTPVTETPEQQSPPEVPPTPPVASSSGDSVTWTASEFMAHEKNTNWYLLLAGGTVVLAILMYLFSRDIISTVVVVIVGILFGMSAGRKPRELSYELDQQGITIGLKHYPYQQFRSFSIDTQGAFAGINFLPLKRFAPPITIYIAPDQEDAAIELLSNFLPMTEHQHDAVDRLLNRIHF